MTGLTLLSGERIPWSQIVVVGDQSALRADGCALSVQEAGSNRLVEVAYFKDRRDAYDCWQHVVRAMKRSVDFDLRITEAEAPEGEALKAGADS